MNFINNTMIQNEISTELNSEHVIVEKETKINDKINFEKKGKQILSKNDFFQDFTKVMKNTTFKNFYAKYFQNWSDIETMVFYMKLYDVLEKEYESRYNTIISDELMTYMLHNIITTTEMRKLAVSSFNDFKNPANNHNKLCKVISFHHEKSPKSLIASIEHENFLELENECSKELSQDK